MPGGLIKRVSLQLMGLGPEVGAGSLKGITVLLGLKSGKELVVLR